MSTRTHRILSSALMGAISMAFMLGLIAQALSTAACGGTNRSDTIHATIISVDAARDGFIAWNREATAQLLDKAEALGATHEQATKMLDDHDRKVDDVLSLFTAVYRSIALAAGKSDDRSLKDAMKAASELFDAIARVRGGP